MKLLQKAAIERERERESNKHGTAWIYTTLRLIYSEPYFFVLLSLVTDTEMVLNSGISAPTPGLVPKTAWHCWLTILSADWLPTPTERFALKTSILYMFRSPTHPFWHSTYAIHLAFELSFAYLKTKLHILILKYTLTGMSKVNIRHCYMPKKTHTPQKIANYELKQK